MVKGIRHHPPTPMFMKFMAPPSSTGVDGTEVKMNQVKTLRISERGGLWKVGHTIVLRLIVSVE